MCRRAQNGQNSLRPWLTNTQSNQQANPLCLHRLVKDISVMGTGTHPDIAATDQIRPIATTTAITIHVRIASPLST
jgi:hypothetical protein